MCSYFCFFIVLFGKIIMKIMFCVIKNIKIINVIGVILLIIYSDDFFNIVLIRFLILWFSVVRVVCFLI